MNFDYSFERINNNFEIFMATNKRVKIVREQNIFLIYFSIFPNRHE